MIIHASVLSAHRRGPRGRTTTLMTRARDPHTATTSTSGFCWPRNASRNTSHSLPAARTLSCVFANSDPSACPRHSPDRSLSPHSSASTRPAPAVAACARASSPGTSPVPAAPPSQCHSSHHTIRALPWTSRTGYTCEIKSVFLVQNALRSCLPISGFGVEG
eukprot:414129-Rhodomonas_salina.1